MGMFNVTKVRMLRFQPHKRWREWFLKREKKWGSSDPQILQRCELLGVMEKYWEELWGGDKRSWRKQKEETDWNLKGLFTQITKSQLLLAVCCNGDRFDWCFEAWDFLLFVPTSKQRKGIKFILWIVDANSAIWTENSLFTCLDCLLNKSNDLH